MLLDDSDPSLSHCRGHQQREGVRDYPSFCGMQIQVPCVFSNDILWFGQANAHFYVIGSGSEHKGPTIFAPLVAGSRALSRLRYPDETPGALERVTAGIRSDPVAVAVAWVTDPETGGDRTVPVTAALRWIHACIGSDAD